jgi:short-subunit dehydrogenase
MADMMGRYVDTEIRQNAYGPKDFNPASGGMMSPKRCAELIVEAADQRRRKVVLTLSGKLAYALRPFVPDIIDMLVKRKAHQKKKAAL